MGKKGGKGKKVEYAGENEVAEIQSKQGESGTEVHRKAVSKDGEEKKEKKGKKGKEGNAKKGVEPESSKLDIQMSISAFLLEHASKVTIDDDEWTWESYTASTESTKEEIPEKGKKGKGKGKAKKGDEKSEGETEEKGGKKGKKGKQGKEKDEVSEIAEDAESTVTDIMAEINKMKELAEAQALAEARKGEVDEASVAPSKKSKVSKKSKAIEETEGEAAPSEKSGPKKKLSKKERARLAAEQAEQARIQAELDAKRAEEEEHLRLIQEKKAAVEKEKRETAEQHLRAEQLTHTINSINLMKKNNMKKALQDKNQREWEQYLKCDGLPDPYVCGQMNTYLHSWEKVIESTTIDDAAIRTIEILKLLDILTTLIDNPIGVDQTLINNWKWIHRLFREYQHHSLDTATYKLLRGISKHLKRTDLTHADYQRKEQDFSISLWLLVKTPVCMPNPRKPHPPRIQIDIPDMRMNVLFPTSLECQCMAVRAMYVKYDHLSDLCASFDKPQVPEQYQPDLYKATLNEWNSKLYYKYEKHHKPKKQPHSEDKHTPKEEPLIDREKGIIPIVPYQKLEPSASIHIIAEEDIMYLQIRDSLITRVDEQVVNLRKYMILGGTYCLDLFYQPPQPQDIVTFQMTVTRLKIPKCLSEVPFHIRYNTPPPIDPTSKREPEEIEEEIKKQEEELDKLLLFTLTLPDHVMWLDVPAVCHWDKKRQVWTTEDVHDLKHIEDKGYITFRSGRFGCFSLAAHRYANLPYQAWELKPELDGTVTLQIAAAILLIEFNVKNDLICILQFQNNTNNALQNIIGIYYKLPKLIRILQEGGVDVFPAFDAFCYIEGTCEKHWPMEKHAYYNMAQLSVCYNFAWSRWNLPAGRRNIVMQMREYKPNKNKQVPHSMLLITPLRVFFIECTEVSQVYNEESVEGMHFYSDLYCLMKGTSSMSTRAKVQNAPNNLVGAVADLLIATRVMSFS